MTDLDTGAYDQLDFDEDDTLAPHLKDDRVPTQSRILKVKKENPRDKVEHTSDLEESIEDDGELKSEDSDANTSHSSEEGEVLSEIEELEVPVERSPSKEETPWERGVRLARERLQKLKVIKATEKDLAEKRMTLAVPTLAVDEESYVTSKEDILWPCYYQAAIVGRTELTGLRFIPEDLQPPTATEIAEWRLGLSDTRRGRQRRRRDRMSSRSGSSSVSSSSAVSSRSSSSDSVSAASSVASVAASWRATCAQALKDYLSSPIRNKDRRAGRVRGSRRSRSESSASGSQFSDSASASDRSEDHTSRRGFRTAHVVGSDVTGKDSGRYWAETKQTSRPVRSGSEQSSGSRSGSQSSEASAQDRRSNNRRSRRDEKWQGSSEHSESPSSPVRRRSDVPLLPHERPVKRPWVAAPGLATGVVVERTGRGPRKVTGNQSGSSSHSGSHSSQAGEERQFITSWSRSPSGGDGQAHAGVVRRERLPDVVPGSHMGHSRRGASPGVKRKSSRSPFAEDKGGASRRDKGQYGLENAAPSTEIPVARRPPQDQAYSENATYTGQQAPTIQQAARETERDISIRATDQATRVVGELPAAASRPGVKITLAPRLKSSAVNMANLGSGINRPGGRPNQPSPPPRLPRLPFPIPNANQIGISSAAGAAEIPALADQAEIRKHAEAAAAVVEARERRRAAAEAARRRRNPQKKRDDLSKIPIRGRPTYRRRSFTDSSLESGSSRSSRSTSTQTSRSGSAQSVEEKPSRPVDQPVELTVHRHRESRKKQKLEMLPVQDVYEELEVVTTHRSRHVTRGIPGEVKALRDELFQRRHPHSNMNYDVVPRHRGERTMEPEFSYKPTVGMQMKGVPPDYSFGTAAAYPPVTTRHRELKSSMTGMATRHRNVADEFTPGYQDLTRKASRHSGAAVLQPMERIVRPRTPHAGVDADEFGGLPVQYPGVLRPSKRERKRNEERGLDFAPPRKRAMIAEPVMEPAVNLELRRARSRHRSRAPGGQIDRSEPFESDSFAAEQRLRELRERLNFVDGAIAELRAGANTADSRR